MIRETYHIRRKLAAVGALVGVAATGAACTSGEATPARTVTRTVTTTAPAPKTSEAPVAPEKLGQAETRFQSTAILVAKQIAEDATNPNSLCQPYNGVSVGNKKEELAHGLEKKGGFPEMFMTYDRAQRQVTMWSITGENPQAPEGQQKFDEVSLLFQSTDPSLNNLERKIAADQQLTPQDYIAFFDGDVMTIQVNTLHGSGADPAYVYLAGGKGGTYQYKAPSASDTVAITDSNSDILDTMSRDMLATETHLRQGI